MVWLNGDENPPVLFLQMAIVTHFRLILEQLCILTITIHLYFISSMWIFLKIMLSSWLFCQTTRALLSFSQKIIGNTLKREKTWKKKTYKVMWKCYMSFNISMSLCYIYCNLELYKIHRLAHLTLLFCYLFLYCFVWLSYSKCSLDNILSI